MTTTYVEVSKELPKPGTIIRMQAYSSEQQDLFGLVVSLDFFNENASGRAKEIFHNPSNTPSWDLMIPAMVMEEDMSWSIRFRQRHHSTVLVSMLDKGEKIDNCIRIISCFTHRDGSRYYACFLDRLFFYGDFLCGRKKIEDFPHFRSNPLEEKFLRSLMEWREENQSNKPKKWQKDLV